jgi:predicted PurR-regulated permease PerM
MPSLPKEAIEARSPFRGPRADLGARSKASDTVIVVAAVICALYFGRDVLAPIALAVLLSFVLAPVVVALTRAHLGRVAPVLLAVTLALVVLTGLGAIIGRQVAQLAEKLPTYQAVITQKVNALQSSTFSHGAVEKAAEALERLGANLTKPSVKAKPSENSTAATQPQEPFVPVEVHEPARGAVQILLSVIATLLPPLATAGVVIIFVVFILLRREDLRDRFIGLTGTHDLHRTTKALDEAAVRLSRYFLALTGVNAAFGVVIAVGLAIIGVPNPILWGIVGAVLRFIPYAGAIIAAAFPLALATAVDPGWSMVFETALLFIVVEAFMGQVIEPNVFGHTTGMSPLAIIVAAAFWTLIWGPAGLLLSTPITACLVVLGRHVESLTFIELLLGDKPPLSSIESFYQRILANDPDEVAFHAESLLKTMTLLEYYEEVALPALALAQADVARGVVESDRQSAVCAAVEDVVEDLSEHEDAPQTNERETEDEANSKTKIAPGEGTLAAPKERKTVLCIAGRTPLDQAGSTILAQILEKHGVAARVEGPQAHASGIFALSADGVNAICVFFLDHRSVASIRYSVRRLRKKFADIPIGICLWGATDLNSIAASAGADGTVGTLVDAISFCQDPPSSRGSTVTTITSATG